MCENRYVQKFDLYRIFKHCKSNPFANNGLNAWVIWNPQNFKFCFPACEEKKSLFSSVDSPSQGKRFLEGLNGVNR